MKSSQQESSQQSYSKDSKSSSSSQQNVQIIQQPPRYGMHGNTLDDYMLKNHKVASGFLGKPI